MNIYDISKKAGVSIATVSRVMNGKGNVSEKTRQKVLDVMQETNYTPNLFARGLNLNSARTIGVMCSDVMDIALAQAVSTTERELRRHDYRSILCCTGGAFEDKYSNLQLLIRQRVDAVVMVGSQFCMPYDNSYIAEAAKEIPIVIINGFIDSENVYCCYCNDTAIVYSTAKKFLQQGHQEILYLYEHESQSGRRKKQGYLQAIAEENLLDHSHILQCSFDIEHTAALLSELLSKEKIHSIIAAEDHLAVSALKAAINLGISVPEELSIVGYNNSMLSLCVNPEITSIDNRLGEMCIHSIQALINVLDGQPVINCTIFPGILVNRKTANLGDLPADI